MGLIMLRFGYTRGLPEEVGTAWGCRAVVTDDGTVHVVLDRISAFGPQINRLREHLDRLPFHRSWQSRAGELLRAGMMDTRVDEEFVLYADDVVMVRGNTQASAGHLYVCAYFQPRAEVFADAPEIAERSEAGEKASDMLEPDERLLDQWLQLGQENPWIREASDPPFTKDSFYGCQSIDELEERLDFTNWSLGQAFYYRNLCFINQVNGGDEWLTIKTFRDEDRLTSLAFESFTFSSYIEEGRFKNLILRLLKASQEDCRRLTY